MSPEPFVSLREAKRAMGARMCGLSSLLVLALLREVSFGYSSFHPCLPEKPTYIADTVVVFFLNSRFFNLSVNTAG